MEVGDENTWFTECLRKNKLDRVPIRCIDLLFFWYACVWTLKFILVKCIICLFSGLITPKLQTFGLTRKCLLFFTAYQTHFLKQYFCFFVYILVS